jgi:hypothetical protein
MQTYVSAFALIASHLVYCYGRLAIVSDVDSEGFVLNVDGGKVQDLDYIKVRTMEQ